MWTVLQIYLIFLLGFRFELLKISKSELLSVRRNNFKSRRAKHTVANSVDKKLPNLNSKDAKIAKDNWGEIFPLKEAKDQESLLKLALKLDNLNDHLLATTRRSDFVNLENLLKPVITKLKSRDFCLLEMEIPARRVNEVFSIMSHIWILFLSMIWFQMIHFFHQRA